MLRGDLLTEIEPNMRLYGGVRKRVKRLWVKKNVGYVHALQE